MTFALRPTDARGVARATDPAPRPVTFATILTAPVSPRTWAATLHVLLDMVVGTVTFTFAVTAVSLVGGLLCTLVLWVPVLACCWSGSGRWGGSSGPGSAPC